MDNRNDLYDPSGFFRPVDGTKHVDYFPDADAEIGEASRDNEAQPDIEAGKCA
jgi:hypothetical protein